MTNGIAIGLSALAGVWLGWHALPIGLCILVIIQIIERRMQVGLLILCGLIMIVGVSRSQSPVSETPSPELALSTGAIGTVSSFPIPSGNGHRALFSVSELCIVDQCVPAETQILVYFAEQYPPVSRGQKLQINWRLDLLESLPPGYRNFVISQGSLGSARASNVKIISEGHPVFEGLARANQFVSSRMEEFLPGDAGALGAGIVTGDDSRLSPAAEADFQATGTSHITAVSGQNVTLIIGFLSMWYRPKTARFRFLFNAILIVAVWSFALFVGMESPVMRAALVASFSIAGSHTGRKPDPVTLLALTIGIIALIQPLSVHAVGFWLSFMASISLCLALPRNRAANAKVFWRQVIGAPIFASIATMPIALMTFGVWSPVGILTNILLAPVMTVAFPATYLFIVLATIMPPVAGILVWVPSILLKTTLIIVRDMAPFAMQLRLDTASPALMAMIWLPILAGIWLASNESLRWIRRIRVRTRN